jgi:preprotein translocase subunit SecA
LAEDAKHLAGFWAGPRRRDELVRQALTALHLFHRDTHYLIRDEKVQIIDEYTGRIMGDRSWELGLHQMIELKEGCPLTPMHSSLARITYQRFFRRYIWLAGMTGTAKEVAGELWNVYRLAVVAIPTNRPLQRHWAGERLFASGEEKWDAAVERISGLHQRGVPVLVGTRSVSASEHLSEKLTAAGVPHVVLNARQDKEEADIVSKAGQFGRVTVATNMAGRGTDIKLAEGVAKLGGLHVLATDRHEAGRIDRQLYGRSGRQGDPGSFETLVSVEDDLLRTSKRLLWRWLARALVRRGKPLQGRLAAFLVRQAQLSAESLHGRIRRDLLQHEDQLETSLAFSGRLE